jgi:hypothetical protein
MGAAEHDPPRLAADFVLAFAQAVDCRAVAEPKLKVGERATGVDVNGEFSPEVISRDKRPGRSFSPTH